MVKEIQLTQGRVADKARIDGLVGALKEVQQVRKATLTEIGKYVRKQQIKMDVYSANIEGWNNAVADILAHIRAMAKKE